ncbi:hypothetical protein C8J57DRAFT_1513262 [Mycena rebaudengoi]|nr:hypothetical protein C8J57DRAFT_1513262 [Mycena rebaudengoi]
MEGGAEEAGEAATPHSQAENESPETQSRKQNRAQSHSDPHGPMQAKSSFAGPTDTEANALVPQAKARKKRKFSNSNPAPPPPPPMMPQNSQGPPAHSFPPPPGHRPPPGYQSLPAQYGPPQVQPWSSSRLLRGTFVQPPGAPPVGPKPPRTSQSASSTGRGGAKQRLRQHPVPHQEVQQYGRPVFAQEYAQGYPDKDASGLPEEFSSAHGPNDTMYQGFQSNDPTPELGPELDAGGWEGDEDGGYNTLGDRPGGYSQGWYENDDEEEEEDEYRPDRDVDEQSPDEDDRQAEEALRGTDALFKILKLNILRQAPISSLSLIHSTAPSLCPPSPPLTSSKPIGTKTTLPSHQILTFSARHPPRHSARKAAALQEQHLRQAQRLTPTALQPHHPANNECNATHSTSLLPRTPNHTNCVIINTSQIERGFPSTSAAQKYGRECIKEAVSALKKEGDPVEPEHKIDKDMICLITEDASSFRSEIKKHALLSEEAGFPFLVAPKVEEPEGQEASEGQEEPGDGNFDHPVIEQAICQFLYEGKGCLAELYPAIFKHSVPRPALALFTTAALCCLVEMQTGHQKTCNFSAEEYGDDYDDLLKKIDKLAGQWAQDWQWAEIPPTTRGMGWEQKASPIIFHKNTTYRRSTSSLSIRCTNPPRQSPLVPRAAEPLAVHPLVVATEGQMAVAVQVHFLILCDASMGLSVLSVVVNGHLDSRCTYPGFPRRRHPVVDVPVTPPRRGESAVLRCVLISFILFLSSPPPETGKCGPQKDASSARLSVVGGWDPVRVR